MPDLRPWFRAQLPPNVLALMDELEAYSRLHIQIVQDAQRTTMGSNTRPDGATIAVPTKFPFLAHSACHELLHIKRYWILRTPLFTSTNPDLREIAGRLNNETEHLAMAPLERQYGFDPTAYNTRRIMAKWAAFDPTLNKDNWAKTYHCLRNLLSRDLLDRDAYETIRSRITESDLEHIIVFTEKVIPMIYSNKPRAMRQIIQFLGLRRKDFRLIYFDIKNRTQKIVPLPL